MMASQWCEHAKRDLIALGLPPHWRWRYIFTNRIAYFEVLLRLVEFQREHYRGPRRLIYLLMRWRFQILSERLGFDIPLGVFGPGLSIAHRGAIVVNGDARVGANCRLHQGVTIGAIRGVAPMIADDVFIGPSVGIYGAVHVGRGAILGPHSLITETVAPGEVRVAPKAATLGASAASAEAES